MSYSPPDGNTITFSFQVPVIPLDFSFSGSGYSPPSGSTISFNFLISLIPLNFNWAPVIAPPISKELLLSLGVRLHGQVYKYWVCYVRLGKQCVRRYWEYQAGHTEHLTCWQDKFRDGVEAWHNLSDSGRLYWHRVGARKVKPITSLNAFLSSWMKDKFKEGEPGG